MFSGRRAIAVSVAAIVLSASACLARAADNPTKSWTLKSGEKFEAKLTGFSVEMVVLQRSKGKVFANGTAVTSLRDDSNFQAFLSQHDLPLNSESKLGSVIAKRGGGTLALPFFRMHYESANAKRGTVAVWLLSADDRQSIAPDLSKWWDDKIRESQQQQEEAQFALLESQEAERKARDANRQWYSIRCGKCGEYPPGGNATRYSWIEKGQDPASHLQTNCQYCGGHMTYTPVDR